jgi:hypothetical protein
VLKVTISAIAVIAAENVAIKKVKLTMIELQRCEVINKTVIG